MNCSTDVESGLLTIVDHFSRESLAIVVDQRLGGHEVAEAFE